MSSLHASLQDFLQLLPVLQLEVLQSSDWVNIWGAIEETRLVVVGADSRPLGILQRQQRSKESPKKSKELQIISDSYQGQHISRTQKLISKSRYKKLISKKVPPPFPLEPLVNLTYRGDLLELWPQVQQELSHTPQRAWALVDEEGKYLGIVEPWRLLRYLAPLLQLSKPNLATSPINSSINSSINSTTNSITSSTINLGNIEKNTSYPTDASLPYTALVKILEQLPLPLMLQTQEGKVVSQNLAWRQQINCSLLVRTDVNFPVDQQMTYLLGLPSPRQKTLKQSNGEISFEAALDSRLMRLKTPDRIWQLVKFPLQGELEKELKEELEKELETEQSTVSPNDHLWLILATDITEQQQVAQELAAKNSDLVQLNRLKDEFLACISHELKTPLTAVLGLSSLLKEKSLGELNDRQTRYVQLIYQSGRQLMLVVNDILDLTRIETEQVEIVLEPVRIVSVCDRAYLQAQQRILPQIEEGKTSLDRQFTLEITPELETVIADESRLRQILSHLLSNALKFTEPEGKLGLTVKQWEDWIAFTVWDTGIGIAIDKQHLIFQKFQQLESPLTRRFEGTGLGLVLAQRLARLHGGDISFTSQPDQGSQFTLLLPTRNLPESQGGSSTPANSPKPSNVVLVIEPVTQYVENLSLNLEALGYRVVIARSGTEALEKARHLKPCLCFLNPLLPLLSGWDVLVLLKSDPQTQHIPILVTATQAEKEEAYAHQADGFLSLPVDQTVLRQYLHQVLQGDTKTLPDYRPITLTILILSPQAATFSLGQSPDFSCLSNLLNQAIRQHPHRIKCRLLEVNDLEQAELLTQVWHPDVLILNGKEVKEITPYLHQLAAHNFLASLPIITLDYAMTEAANSMGNLVVFPCLSADSCLFGSELDACYSLLQVIEVAIFSHYGKSF